MNLLTKSGYTCKLILKEQAIIIMFGIEWPWTKKALDPQKTYLRIQFLTAQEKSYKVETIKRLQKKYQNDEQSIVPYQGSFSTSFQFTLNTTQIAGNSEPIKNKIHIKQLISHLQVTKNQQLQEFMKTQVKNIQVIVLNQKMIQQSQVISLYSQVQTSIYTPSEVLQIIYQQHSLWQRVKNGTKKFVRNLPKKIFSFGSKLLFFILGLFGFQTSASSLFFRFIPTKSILQWLISLVCMFFPMLSPVITIGSKYMLS